jgi:hypothetical protein
MFIDPMKPIRRTGFTLIIHHLHFFVYNFITRHGTLRMPPALKAGVADDWWMYEELVELIDNYDATEKPVNWAEKIDPDGRAIPAGRQE